MKTHSAEIISIGNEVLAGYTVNTNATFISQQLLSIGLPVHWVSTISDEHNEILHALQTASKRADVILITGGLGPTPDDLTKKAICDYFQVGMRQDESVLTDVLEFLKSRNVKATNVNKAQALVPDCDFVVRNEVGTAPGIGFERDGSYFFFMPGVPGEMKRMVTNHILNFLKSKLSLVPVYTRLLRTTGIPESRLYERLQQTIEKYPHIQVSFLPRYIGVDLRFRLISEDKKAVNQLQALIDETKSLADKYIFSDQELELEEVLGQILKEKNLTISMAESFTGGLLADLITNIPGSSEYLMQSVVTYSNESKMQVLGVSSNTLMKHGAVSKEIALEMVRGIQQKAQTDCAIATTGIAGPGGATDTKPVGLCYVAARFGTKEVVKEFRFGTERLINKKRGAMAGMEMLRRLLLNID